MASSATRSSGPTRPATPSAPSPTRAVVDFPSDAEGNRSTSTTGRTVLAAAARAADEGLAGRIAATRDWRSDYVGHFGAVTALSARDPETALAVARAGMGTLRATMALVDGDHDRVVADGLPDAEAPQTVRVGGRRPPVRELAVPYRGRELRGDELRRQLDAWTRDGIVEPSFTSAIESVIAHPEWLSLPGRRLALLGAGAEMGPLEPLTRWGADVLALDLPAEPVWERILDLAREGAGTVRAPRRPDARGSRASDLGIDLMRAAPQAAAWIAEQAGHHRLVLGTHAYADGGAHVRLTAAAEAIADALRAADRRLALAFLATPTDAFLVDEAILAEARRRWSRRRLRLAQALARRGSGGRLFAPAYAQAHRGEDGRTWGLADVLVAQQGPNYALAKRAQRWRGMLAEAAGELVSFNVAPASWTRSVTSNRVLAAAYGGAHRFGVEILEPETTRVLMAAMLVHDLHRGPVPRRHPEELFCDGAAHGGLWRSGYEPRSVLPVAALGGLPAAVRAG